MTTEIELHNTMDALVWANEFTRRFGRHLSKEIDEGLLVGWFANAIMTGYDTAMQKQAGTIGEMEMKQFDPSKPYQTRSGLKVGELHKYKIKYNDIVLEKFYSTIYFDTDHEVIHTWLLDGKSDSDHRNSEYDLVNTPEKEEAEMTDECKQYREGDDTLSCSCHINPPCSTCVDMLKENICELNGEIVSCYGDITLCEYNDLRMEEKP